MKPFEKRYDAWLQGHLAPQEAAAFERELDQRPVQDEPAWESDLLRQYGTAPRLTNEDFFSHRLMAQIRCDLPVQTMRPRLFRWSLPSLVWGGVACLLVAAGVFQVAVAPQLGRGPTLLAGSVQAAPVRPAYLAQILAVHAADESISVTPVHSPQDNVTVLWLEGLPFLDDEYILQ